MFKDNLILIMQEINNFNPNKDYLFAQAVAKRLDKSLESYTSELNDSCSYTSNRNSLYVMKKVGRL